MAEEIIIKVKLDGATEEIKRLETLQKKINQLAEEKKRLSKTEKELTKAVNESGAATKEQNQSLEKIAAQQTKNNLALSLNKKALSDNQRQVIANTKANDLNKGSLVELRAQLSKDTFAYDRLTKAERDNVNVGGKLQQSIKRQSDALKGLENQTGRNQRSVGNYKKAFGSLRSLMLKGLGALGITAGLAGLVRVMRGAINITKDFEQGNANLAAVLGKTRSDIKALSEDAKRLGATTAFTASEVSKLQTEFAKLGFNETEILNATEATLNLAAATGSDLAEAAAIAGATLGGFGLDAKETQRITDVMAKSFSTSALDINKFQESMKTAAPAAKAVGVSVEETTALLGTLSNAGISGSIAGTALRKTFIELNAAGLTLDEGLAQVANSEDKLGAATDLVGKKAASSFLVLAEGVEITKELEEGLNDAGGAAETMANEQLDTLEGKMKILNSAWEGFILSLDDGNSSFSRAAKNVLAVATELLSFASGTKEAAEGLNEYETKVRSTANRVVFFAKAVASLLAGFIAYKATLIATRAVTVAITAAQRIAAFTTTVLSKGIKAATVSQKGLNTAMKSNPIGLIVSLLATAATAFFAYKNSADEAAEATEGVGDEIEEAARRLKLLNSISDRSQVIRSLSKKQLENLKSDIQAEVDLQEEKQAQLVSVHKKTNEAVVNQTKLLNKKIKEELEERARFGHAWSEQEIKDSENIIKRARFDIKAWQADLKEAVVDRKGINESNEQILAIEKQLESLKKIDDSKSAKLKLKNKDKEKEAIKGLITEQTKLKKIAEELPELTEAEITAKNVKIKTIDKEIARLKNLGETEEELSKKKAGLIDDEIEDITLLRQLELATIDETNEEKIKKETDLLNTIGALRVEKAKLNGEDVARVELENEIAKAEQKKEFAAEIEEEEKVKKEEDAEKTAEVDEQKLENDKFLKQQSIDIAAEGAKALLAGAEAKANREKDIELANLNARLEGGLISQEDFERKKNQIEREAFKKKKQRDLGVIAIDLAKEISAINVAAAGNPSNSFTFGGAGVAQSAVLTGIAIARSAIQAGIVGSQKFAGGGIIHGASHAQGGVQLGNNQEGEGGEAIINKRSTSKHLGLLSAINQDGGGVSFSSSLPSPNLSTVTSKFANGGVMANGGGQALDINDLRAAFSESMSTIQVQNVASETTGVANRVQQIEDSASF